MPSSLSLVGVIGDVHCDDIFLEKSIEHLKSFSPDKILCVGDVADGVGDFSRCVGLLKEHDVITVKGNHDRWLHTVRGDMDRDIPNLIWPEDCTEEDLKFIRDLPVRIDFETPKGRLLFCHGVGDYDMGGVEPGNKWYDIRTLTSLHDIADSNDYAFIVNGHTHVPMVENFKNVVIINAGTIVRDQDPVCLLVDFEMMHVRTFDMSDENFKERLEKING